MLALWSIPIGVRILLTFLVFVALVYILFRFRADKNPAQDSLDLLEERMEKGEVSFKDYLHAKRSRGK
ncbi:MAG TPA: hypothetical protein VIG73_06535 [Cerasibacillus sp.]|uniref:hypothetical protein n=1 Tax=Cerasibacillus sp. TaxID=2498711 RepID=UPI002F3E4AC9